MTSSRLELVGIVLAVGGVVAIAVAAGALAGWPVAALVAGVFAVVSGVLLVRLAALTPTTTGTGGD